MAHHMGTAGLHRVESRSPQSRAKQLMERRGTSFHGIALDDEDTTIVTFWNKVRTEGWARKTHAPQSSSGPSSPPHFFLSRHQLPATPSDNTPITTDLLRQGVRHQIQRKYLKRFDYTLFYKMAVQPED